MESRLLTIRGCMRSETHFFGSRDLNVRDIPSIPWEREMKSERYVSYPSKNTPAKVLQRGCVLSAGESLKRILFWCSCAACKWVLGFLLASGPTLLINVSAIAISEYWYDSRSGNIFGRLGHSSPSFKLVDEPFAVVSVCVCEKCPSCQRSKCARRCLAAYPPSLSVKRC